MAKTKAKTVTRKAEPKRRPNQRKFIRFKPDEGTAALVDQISWGLVVDEAFGGCGLVMLGREKYQPGDLCQIQIGEIGPLRARVAWRLKVSDDVIKIGLEFLE